MNINHTAAHSKSEKSISVSHYLACNARIAPSPLVLVTVALPGLHHKDSPFSISVSHCSPTWPAPQG